MMEYNLTSLKGATEKLFMANKNRIGIVHKSKQTIQKKLDELNEYHNQQRTLDSEIEGQLNIMYKISMQLQTKKQDIITVFDKYNPDLDRLQRALDALKLKSIDESLIQQSEENDYIFANLPKEEESKVTGNLINSNSTASNEDDGK